MNKKDIERKYNQLLRDVATNDFYKKIDLTNRVNCYSCESCGHITKTQDVDAGTIPMFFVCELCNNRAHSSFFKDLVPKRKPTIEWYRPTLNQVLEMRTAKPAMLDHILMGGLDFRKISE